MSACVLNLSNPNLEYPYECSEQFTLRHILYLSLLDNEVGSLSPERLILVRDESRAAAGLSGELRGRSTQWCADL